MSILQISKIQQRSGNLVDLPQLDEAEFGWASDQRRLFIGKTTPNENVEVLTGYSTISFSQIDGAVGNLNITAASIANGQVLTFDGTNWVNRGGNAGGLITLGDASNVKLSGGADGYILQTDGTGNLSWTPKATITAFIENAESTTIVKGLNYATSTNGTTEVITLSANYSYSANTPVIFSGTDFGNIFSNTTYYIKNVVSNNSITISSTLGGSNLNLSTDTGNLTMEIIGTVVTTTQDNFFTDSSKVTITNAQGMTELNGSSYYADVLTSNTFALYSDPGLSIPVDSSSYPPYSYTTVSGTTINTNRITVGSSTQFTANAAVSFVGNMSTSGITTNTTYYVYDKPTGTTIRIATSADGNTSNILSLQTTVGLTAHMYQQGGRVIANVGGSGGVLAASPPANGIQFNSGGILAGSSDLTYDRVAKLLTINGNINVGNLNSSDLVTGTILVSSIVTGTAPLQVASTTRVNNLNVAHANVSDYSAVTTQTTGTFYPIFVSANTSANYALSSNANISFDIATGLLTTPTLEVIGNANVGNINAGAGSFSGTVITGSGNGGNITGANVVNANLFIGGNVITTSYNIRSITAGIAAAGSTQGTATALTKEINVVSTVSSGANGVVLPTAVAGMVLIINNTSADTLNVYPATGGNINSGSVNAAYPHGSGASLQYYATSDTQWYTVGATFA